MAKTGEKPWMRKESEAFTRGLELAETLGWPGVSLGEREVNGRTVSVGVPGDRFAWQQASRFWPNRLLAELLTRLLAMRDETLADLAELAEAE